MRSTNGRQYRLCEAGNPTTFKKVAQDVLKTAQQAVAAWSLRSVRGVAKEAVEMGKNATRLEKSLKQKGLRQALLKLAAGGLAVQRILGAESAPRKPGKKARTK